MMPSIFDFFNLLDSEDGNINHPPPKGLSPRDEMLRQPESAANTQYPNMQIVMATPRAPSSRREDFFPSSSFGTFDFTTMPTFGNVFFAMDEEMKRMHEEMQHMFSTFSSHDDAGLNVLMDSHNSPDSVFPRKPQTHFVFEQRRVTHDGQGNTIITHTRRLGDEERTVVTKRFPDGSEETQEKVANIMTSGAALSPGWSDESNGRNLDAPQGKSVLRNWLESLWKSN